MHPDYAASCETDGKAFKDIIGNARMSAAARGESRMRCSRLLFILSAGIVHTAASRSNSPGLEPYRFPGARCRQDQEFKRARCGTLLNPIATQTQC
jgi:hypothetical protein